MQLLLGQSRRRCGPLELFGVEPLQNAAHPLEQLGVGELCDQEIDDRLRMIDRQVRQVRVLLPDLHMQIRLLELNAQNLCILVCQPLLLLPFLFAPFQNPLASGAICAWVAAIPAKPDEAWASARSDRPKAVPV